MSRCAVPVEQAHRYIDGELAPGEVLEFEKHLMDCRECHARYESLRAVADVVRGAKPLYEVPETSFLQARALVERHEAERRRWLRAAAAVFVVGVVGWLGFLLGRHLLAPRFPEFAADVHVRHSGERSPLGIVSSRPDVVSGWLQQRLEFPAKLPDYPVNAGERKRYRLVGADVLQYEGEKVAYVAYEMDRKPIPADGFHAACRSIGRQPVSLGTAGLSVPGAAGVECDRLDGPRHPLLPGIGVGRARSGVLRGMPRQCRRAASDRGVAAAFERVRGEGMSWRSVFRGSGLVLTKRACTNDKQELTVADQFARLKSL